MASLTVWKFNTADGADKALAKLGDLQKQQLIQVLDAAIRFLTARTQTPQNLSSDGHGGIGNVR